VVYQPLGGWVAVTAINGSYRVSLHTVQDPDDDHAGDLAEFLSLDPPDEQYVGEGRELGHSADEEEAIQLAERLTTATPARWVNYAVTGEDYTDYVRARPKAIRQT
jgi:hypothetical protein